MRRAFAVALIAGMLVLPGVAHAGDGWITSTCYSHSLMDDPLVYPGVPGASHLHDFTGATTTDADSTAASLLAGGTCTGTPGDNAAYWVPRVITANRGMLVPSAGSDRDMLAYYFRVAGSNVQPFPFGFSMILGNAHAMRVADNADLADGHIYFKCGPGSATHLPTPPTSCSSGHFLVVVYTFPQFWSGQQVAGNDIGQMSYRQDAAHPISLPRLQLYWRYSGASGSFGAVSFASGPFYTAHADFFNAWQPAALASLVSRCINVGNDCGTDPSG